MEGSNLSPWNLDSWPLVTKYYFWYGEVLFILLYSLWHVIEIDISPFIPVCIIQIGSKCVFSYLLLSSRELLEQVAEFEKAEFISSNKKVIFGHSKSKA